MLLNRVREALRVGGRFKEIGRLHDAVISVKRHDHRIRRVTPGDDCDIGIVHDLIEDTFEIIACFGKINDVRHGLNSIDMSNILNMYNVIKQRIQQKTRLSAGFFCLMFYRGRLTKITRSLNELRPAAGTRAEFRAELAYQLGMRVPVIAAVNGACAGIGLAVAAWCDLRFVSATAKLTTAAPKLGLPAEYGLSWLLPRLVGITRANDLLLSGRIVTGEETRHWGLWNDVLPDGESALAAALDYAQRLATTVAPSSVAATKRQIADDLLSNDPSASVETSRALLNTMTGSAEYREGIAALREKRPPNF